MSVRFSDGTVVPSFLGEFVDPVLYPDGSHTNVALRVGEIVAATDGGDDGNFIQQYTVRVYQQNGKRAATPVYYYNCTVMSLFGGSADYTRWTLRPAISTEGTSNASTTGFGNGSQVLLLCINGRTTNAWIVGGILQLPSSNTQGTPEDTPIGDDANNPQLTYDFNYNGVNVNINPDGEYTVNVIGSTDIDGNSTTNQPEVTIQADKNSNIILKSEGVLTGEATDNTVLGTTYINAEVEALNDFVSDMQQAAAQIAAAGTALLALSPGASTALTQASMQILSALESLTNFTGNQSDYLSKKNLSD